MWGQPHGTLRWQAGGVTRTLYFTATSTDGFIADEDNSLDWLFACPHDEEDDTWERFVSRVGPMAMGATTYEWVLEHEDLLAHPGRWQEMYADRPCWVFTHRVLPAVPGVDLRFVSGDVRPAYDAMVAAADGTDIWIVGGGDLVGQFDDAGLLDEIWLGMRPVFLGAGAPLLPRRITSARVTLREARQVGQAIRIVYDVARPA
jgi:dihydrofolate reductase